MSKNNFDYLNFPDSKFNNQQILKDKKILLIGAGGIGCELLKSLVMIGIKKITIIDLDIVEKSNLNRQFLFDINSVGKYKSITAKDSIIKLTGIQDLEINSFIGNIKDLQKFNFNFFKSFDLILNALDNIDARSYINRICNVNNICLLNSGTEGYLGAVFCFSGKDTACYDCSVKIRQKTIPICSIRTKPEKIEHCIAWAKALFELFFCMDNSESNPLDDYIEILLNEKNGENFDNKNSAEESLLDFKFLGFFRNLFSNPTENNEQENLESKNEENLNNLNSKIKNNFVIEKINSILEKSTDFNFLKNSLEYLSEFLVKLFDIDDNVEKSIENLVKLFISSVVLLELKYKVKKPLFESFPQIKYLIKNIFDLKNNKNISLNFLREENNFTKINLLKFDKEDDLIINFIFSASNLRALNFNINCISRFKTKDIAGNIVPAIASTNAIIASIQAMEAMKVLLNQNEKKYSEFIKNSSFNKEKKVKSESSINYLKNPLCSVCSNENFYTNLEINLNKFTLNNLLEKICKEKLKIENPIIISGKDLIYDFEDESSNDLEIECENSPKHRKINEKLNFVLTKFNIVNNSVVKIQDLNGEYDNKISLVINENINFNYEFILGDLSYYENFLSLKKDSEKKIEKEEKKEIENNIISLIEDPITLEINDDLDIYNNYDNLNKIVNKQISENSKAYEINDLMKLSDLSEDKQIKFLNKKTQRSLENN